MTTPYTYCVTHKPTGKRYYGVRYKTGCNPSELWKDYFTSSKVVAELVDKDGTESFNAEVRKVFESRSRAKLWEHDVLRRLKVTTNDKWLNQSTGGKRFRKGMSGTAGMTGKRHSQETKDKMRRAKLAKIENDPEFAEQLRAEARKKFNSPKVRAAANLSRVGSKRTDEQRENIRQGRLRYIATHKGVPCSEEKKDKIRKSRLETERKKREMVF